MTMQGITRAILDRAPWALATVLLVAGCTSTSTSTTRTGAPEWVNGPARAYPAEQYLVGRGEAANVEQAQERARADLARIFEIAVSVESRDEQSYQGQGADGRFEASATRRITTRTDKIVSGMRIAELWQDPATRQQHALAALPRAQAAASLREEIARRDEAIARHVAQARAAADLLAQVGAASRALDMAIERDDFQRSLKVVDHTGRGVESEYGAARLRADLDDIVKRVRIAPGPSGDAEADKLGRAALAAAGFVAAEDPIYLVETRLKLETPLLKDGWFWSRGTLEATLVEAASGRVRGARAWIVKGSGAEAASARARVVREAQAVLNKELRATLAGFAVAP
jgi:hypothetical protein